MKTLKLLAVALVAAVLFSTNAFAALTPNSAVTAQTPNRAVVQFLQGTDTAGTYKTLITANANATIVKGIFLTSNDPSASHLVTCEIVNSAVKYGGMAITVPTTTPGYASGVGALNLMAPQNWPGLPLDDNGNPYLQLISGDTLQCTFATALTASDKINIVAIDADF